MNKPEDSLYLKQFVKKHPDNRMGWYLLGKHYRDAGKIGKANYCFMQAGDVYEAFEQESHPLAMEQQQLELLKQWDKRQQRQGLIRKVAAAALLLLLAALVLPLEGQMDPDGGEEALYARVSGIGVLFIPQGETEPVSYALNELVAAEEEVPSFKLAVKLDEREGWSDWGGNAQLMMAVNHLRLPSQLEVTMFDREACYCEAADPGDTEEKFKEWQGEQEIHWSLASAIYQYKRKFGEWPKRLNDLLKPYPNNVMAGEGEGMADMFPYVLERVVEAQTSPAPRGGGEAKEDAGGNRESAQRPGAKESVGPNGLYDRQWNEPFEVIVDAERHRLAVVQNRFIIRSYPIGLGGERTPTGSFYISEKVRDPQGKAEGMFGSRGLVLSDTLYAIHGTADLDSIGGDESLGCIRMSNEDVEELYDLVPLGTKVTIKGGSLPPPGKQPDQRFRLKPGHNETNPSILYQWLS